MMRAIIAYVFGASVGCGRIAFDPLGTDAAVADASASDTSDAALGLPLCLDDNFDDNDVSDWQISNGEWTLQTGGPDGSLMLHNDATTPVGITHPVLRAVNHALASVDIRIESAATGDFDLEFLAPGWIDEDTDSQYRVGLFPFASDSADDTVRRIATSTITTLAQRPVSLMPNTWYRLQVLFAPDHSFEVSIDGISHMTSPADTGLTGPFDIAFDFYGVGAIDNVRVFCE